MYLSAVDSGSKQVPLLLASASPRRKEILDSMKLRFSAQSADIDETPLQGETPKEMVQRLALAKAEAVAVQQKKSLVLGSDSIVAINGRIIGKPEDADHAAKILKSLSGLTHEVITGVAFVHVAENLREVSFCSSSITFHELDDKKINEYIAIGEYKDKAGGYAIQGHGTELVKSYSGSFSNIVGLPVRELLRFMAGYGLERFSWKD